MTSINELLSAHNTVLQYSSMQEVRLLSFIYQMKEALLRSEINAYAIMSVYAIVRRNIDSRTQVAHSARAIWHSPAYSINIFDVTTLCH
jgi:hypothetical protein